MIRIEDRCVSCPTEMGCLGQLCPNQNVEVHYCDRCGEEQSLYMIDDEECCEDCAKDYVVEYFRGLSMSEKLEIAEKIKLIHIIGD